MRIPSLTMDILVAVIALVERKTYELAGEELSLSASAVHKRVRIAESRLGHRLFLSSADGMLLTKGGQTFYPEAVRTVEQALLAEEKMKSLAELDDGQLFVGHSTYLPPRLLGQVMQLGTDLPTDMSIQHVSGITASLVKRVVDGTLHAAFADLPVVHPSLLTHPLLEEPVVVCLPKSHPLAVKPLIRFQDLKEVPMIAVSRESLPLQHQEIKEYFDGSGIHLNVVADAFGPPEALHMVEQHVGVCLLGASAARSPSVVAKSLPARTLTHKVGICVREDNRHPALQQFVDLVFSKVIERRQDSHSYTYPHRHGQTRRNT